MRRKRRQHPRNRRAVGVAAQRYRAVARLASSHYGVVTREQLLQLGLGPGAIDHWVRVGRLHPVHRGVYLLGHTAEHPRAREMAAVLACQPHAALSHESAAYLWRLLRRESRPTPIHVSVTGRTPGRKLGLRIHRASDLGPDAIRRLGSIPVTSPERTIADLAATAPARLVEGALAEAEVRRLVTRESMAAVVERSSGRAGARLLRALTGDGPSLTRSQAEKRLLRLIRRGGLPRPVTNARVGPFEVDCLWPRERVIVEVDGFRFHGPRRAFERDRGRDAELSARGYVVVRATWRQLVNEPEAFLVKLARTLAARASIG